MIKKNKARDLVHDQIATVLPHPQKIKNVQNLKVKIKVV